MDGAYREWAGGGGGVGRRGWVASRRWANTAIRAQTVVLCSQQTTGMYTNHRTNSVLHGWQKAVRESRPGYIYSQAVDVRGRCMSESLKLGHNLDFSSCGIMVGFHKSSHI